MIATQLALEFDAPRIQDYILSEVPGDGESRPRRRPAPPEYHVVINSGPDFVASRTYRGKTSTLVLLVSQGQYYIRQGDNIKALTGRRLSQWVGGNDTIDEDIRPNWSRDSLLRYDRAACVNLMRLITIETARELMKRDLLRVEALQLSRLQTAGRLTACCEWDTFEPVCRVLLRHFGHDTVRDGISGATRTIYPGRDDSWIPVGAVVDEADFAVHLLEQLGPDNFTKILNAMDIAFGNCHALWHTMFHTQRIIEILHVGEADVSNARIADYLANIIAHAPDGPERGLDAYATFLRVQLQARDRITDPMPRDLNAAAHALIAEWGAQINSAFPRISDRAAALADEGYEDDNFVIRPIRDYSELQQEADRMHNCLENYAADYDHGRCELWVMRRKARPDRPYIDIEVRGNRLRQAFRVCNEHLSEHEWDIVDHWCDRRNVNPITHRNVPLPPPGY